MPVVTECINLQNRMWKRPNAWNHCLDEEVAIWNQVIARGGLEDTCGWNKRRRYEKRPWHEMPVEGERLLVPASIPLPADDGADNLVLEYRMPVGWDGVIQHLSCRYTGTGFVDYSGDILWRLKVGERWIPGFEAVPTQLNELTKSYVDVGAYTRLLSLQFVRVYAAVAVGAAATLAGGRIAAAITGYKYPRR